MNYLKLATQLSCMSRYSASLQWLWRRILREYSRGMYLGFWIFLYWTTLCWGRGQEQEYLSLIMKDSSTRKSRRTLGESFCTDISGNKIKHGNPFVPEGDNFCLHCKCLSGQAKECFTTDCAVPTCKKYKAVPGKCCAYTCPSGSNSEAAELAIIISLSVGLLLLLVLLIFVIDRNRKKNQRNRMRNEVLEQSQNLRPRPLNNRLAAITEENNDGIEPPPPYTPGRGRYSFRKPQYASPPFTPNEPPPPYEIDSRDATDV